MPKRLQVGDVAPDFTLSSSTGETIHLYDVLERSQVVLFFYPRAFTPVCTAEVCGFRDTTDQFTALNAAVFGISSDAPDTLARFAKENKIGFPLLADEGNQTRVAFAVPKMFGLLPGRVTFVIGRDRKIKHITVAGLSSDVHISESLKRLQNTPIET
jgi:thioredoxin-dependent peroxiredoxin